MKKTLFAGFVTAFIVLSFSLTAVIAQEKAPPDPAGGERAVVAPAAPARPARAGEEAAPPPNADTKAAGRPVPTAQFPVAPLCIGLGLAAAIVLCIFKWGADAQPNKQEK